MGKQPLSKRKSDLLLRSRTLARLAAVQGLYQIDYLKSLPHTVISDFKENGLQIEEDLIVQLKEPDFAATLIQGVCSRKSDIDEIIKKAISNELSHDRLDGVLKNILRSGIYELLAQHEIPTSVIINEYIDIAHLYYEGGEPKIVNGVLDKLSSILRPQPSK